MSLSANDLKDQLKAEMKDKTDFPDEDPAKSEAEAGLNAIATAVTKWLLGQGGNPGANVVGPSAGITGGNDRISVQVDTGTGAGTTTEDGHLE